MVSCISFLAPLFVRVAMAVVGNVIVVSMMGNGSPGIEQAAISH